MAILSHDDLDALVTKIHDNAGDALPDITEDLNALRQDSFERESVNAEQAEKIAKLEDDKAKLVTANSGMFAELGKQRKDAESSKENKEKKEQENLTIDEMVKK